MLNASDKELVREFAENSSEAAFSELVSRHINLVYSVALRYTANGEDAQDVTQAVFIILAKKAVRLRERTALTGWLYETTRLAASGCLRARARRQTHEHEAVMQSDLNESASSPLWEQLAPHLEEAMSRLGEGERALLAMRYFENKTGAEAAALLGIREAAAHKRTTRALEKLRSFFVKRGVAASAVAIASAVSANSVQAAPTALAKTVSAVAMTHGAAISVNLSMLIKGTMKAMTWVKLKFAVSAGVAILLAGGATALVESPKISEQSYLLKGQFSYSYGTNRYTTPIEVFRKGDILKITEIIQPAASNYWATAFICTKTNSINFNQLPKETVMELSNYRQPFYYHQSLVWLMVQGGTELERGFPQAFHSIYVEPGQHEFPIISPKTSRDTSWTAGFSDYSDTFTNRNGVIQQTTFKIQDWTNVAGVKFPKSFTTILNRTETDTNTTLLFPITKETRYEFVVTQIEELPGKIDTRIPTNSGVIDWRPREEGTSEAAMAYETTNGVIFTDVLKAAKEQGPSSPSHFFPIYDDLQFGRMGSTNLAPDFEIKTLNGKSLKLSSLRGKYVLLTFWSSTSAPCIRQIPELKETYEAFGKDGRLTMLGMALEDEQEKVEATVAKYQINWPQALANNLRYFIIGNYKVYAVPAVFLIDPDGKILRVGKNVKETVDGVMKSEKKN